MPEEVNYYGLVNKPPIDEIYNLDLVNKPDILSDELSHYGILGMHWGVRRYQNPDGTLTNAGKKRLAKRQAKLEKKAKKAAAEREKKILNPNEKYISKNIEKFSNDEIRRALERMEWKRRISEIHRDRIRTGKDKVDTLLRYGDTLNNAIAFYNSNAGKAIRKKLGLGTDTKFDFNSQEDRVRKRQDAYNKIEEDIHRKRREKESNLKWEFDKRDWLKKNYGIDYEPNIGNKNDKNDKNKQQQSSVDNKQQAVSDDEKKKKRYKSSKGKKFSGYNFKRR